MNDMSAVIAPKSDQLNSDDLIAGPRTIRIRDVTIRPGTEQPVSIFYDGDNGKPWKPCKSASRVLVAAWGPDAKVYMGRSLTIYRDAGVTWGGMAVGGIRVSHLSDIDRPLVIALTEKKGSKKVATIAVLSVERAEPALTVQQAELDMRAAKSLADLEAVWRRKTMAPFRDGLNGALAECKAALVEPENATDLIARFDTAMSPVMVENATDRMRVLGLQDDEAVAAADVAARARLGMAL